MEENKERLVIEREELKEKFLKLVDFINSEEFFQMSPNNKQLLKNQKIVMELYLNVLNMRVYEDVDSIIVPDYGMMQMVGNVFGGSSFPKPGLKVLEENVNNTNQYVQKKENN